MKDLETKLKKFMRKQMKKIGNQVKGAPVDTDFAFCWGQATFDLLMALDRELELGAFYRKGGK